MRPLKWYIPIAPSVYNIPWYHQLYFKLTSLAQIYINILYLISNSSNNSNT